LFRLGKNIIDLVSYPHPWDAVVAVGEATLLGFRASYSRFMAIGIS
jgi:hypothetical protein